MFEKPYLKITRFNITTKKLNLQKQNQIIFAPNSTTGDSSLSLYSACSFCLLNLDRVGLSSA